MGDSPINVKFSADGSQVLASVDPKKVGSIPIVAEQILMALEEIGAQEFDIDYPAIDRRLFPLTRWKQL